MPEPASYEILWLSPPGCAKGSLVMKYNLLMGLTLLLCAGGNSAQAQVSSLQTAADYDSHAAVIFAYNRIGEDAYPDTSIRTEQFIAHIRELSEDGYTVKPLPEIVEALKNGLPLPPKTVAITFDGGYASIAQRAIPLLEESNLPYTIFVSPSRLDSGSTQYMNWKTLRSLHKSSLATIGLHPADYTRLQDKSEEEIKRQINSARTRLREELNITADLFAYPFGEYSAAYRKIIEEQGFTAAFGQQSGTAYPGEDILALPRFPMTEQYADTARFRMAAAALPLPVTDRYPATPNIGSAGNPPQIGFTIAEFLTPNLDKLSCFISGQPRPQMEILNEKRIELRPAMAFEDSRIRINCTLPAPPSGPDMQPRWRWLGMLLTRPETDTQTY